MIAQLGGEAMMEFSPSGVRATYLNLGESTLTPVGDDFVAVAGGTQAWPSWAI